MNSNITRNRIRTIREKKQISQEDMAQRLFIDKRTYQRIESGEKKLLDIDMLGKISEILEVEVADLIASDSVHIEHIGDNSEQSVAIGYNNDLTVNNHGMSSEVKHAFDELMKQFHEVIAMKDQTIATLQQLLDKYAKS